MLPLVSQLVAFAAALVALRLSGLLAVHYRSRRAPELAAWTAALLAYAVACGALAWGAAAGWDGRVFRIYYLFGGLLAAPLLGAGSLLLASVRRWTVPAMLVYVGIAIGVASSMPLRRPVHGNEIPAAASHLDVFPARALAVVANSAGTLAVVGVALLTVRRRPLGNAFIVIGVATAAIGSSLPRIGEAATAFMLAVGATLLFVGFIVPSSLRSARCLLTRTQGIRLNR
jgi:hypothetical protein